LYPLEAFHVNLSNKSHRMKQILILIAGIFFIGTGISAQKSSISEVSIVTSAQCDMCKKRIEEGLYTQKGVIEANLNVETKVIRIKFRNNKTTEADLRKYISSIGYNADDVVADKTAYDQLPGCCQAEGMK
jgi:mercuric ion binding protein